MAIKSKRIPVLLDAETYARLKSYSALTGIPVARVAREAMADWLATAGAGRLEALTAYSTGKVLAITDADKNSKLSAGAAAGN